MAMGVDPNGNPVAENTTQAVPRCASGQTYDQNQQQCVPTSNAGTQPAGGAPQQGPTADQTPSPTPQPNPAPAPSSNIDPRIQALYTKYGVTAGPSGSGLVDGSYWSGKINAPGMDPNYIVDRLGSDLAGTGPDLGKGGNPSGGAMTPTDFLAQSGGLAPNLTPPPSYQVPPGSAPTVTPYTPTQFTQPTPYAANPTQNQTGQLIAQLLSGGGSMNPAVVAQMKEQQKSTALSMQDQIKQQIMQSGASRGVLGGGSTAGQISDLQQKTAGDISSGYANTDINAAKTNFTDMLNAAGASDTFNSGLLDQYLKTNGLNLQTQQAQASENQAAQASKEQGVSDYLGIQGLNLGASNTAFNNWLASQGLTLNWRQLAEQARGTDLNNQLGVATFLGS